MRTDTQNLLDRLDQPDFQYREFQSADEARRGFGWPLLDLVHRVTAGHRRRSIVAPVPAPAAEVVEPTAPAPVAVEPAAPPARSFFARYGDETSPAGSPLNRQPGDR